MTAYKKKILILCDWFYPGYKGGGPIQSCRNFISAMHNVFDFAVVTSDKDAGDLEAYQGVKINEWNNYNNEAKVFYASALTPALLNKLEKEFAADYIYLNSMFSLRFAIYPLWLVWRNKIKAQLVLAPRGMLQKGALQFKPQKKKLFLNIVSKSGVEKKIIFHATDEQEALDTTFFFPLAKKIQMATNFPKTDKLPFVYAEKKPGSLKCVFISRISEKKNLHYFLALLQQMPSDVDLQFEIVGEPEDENYWKQCKELIASMPGWVKVTVTGPLNNDEVPHVLQRNHLFVLPTLGENFGHAIFEALLAGRPVLISDKTPWKELAERKAGWDISLSNKESFKNILLKVTAMNADELNELCIGARKLAEQYINETDIKEQYLKLFN